MQRLQDTARCLLMSLCLGRSSRSSERCAWRTARSSSFCAAVSLTRPKEYLRKCSGGMRWKQPSSYLALLIDIINKAHPIVTPFVRACSPKFLPYLLILYQQDRMEPTLPFEQSEDGVYRIVSALDQKKCFTVQQAAPHSLVIDSYHGTNNQKFNIFANNGKYAFVCLEGNLAVMLPQDSAQDGAHIQADAGQHKSSFFQMATVTTGPFAGKAFYLKTHCGKCVDVNEGKTSPGTAVIQWSYHGHTNQIWLAIPNSQQPGQQQPQQQQQGNIAFQEVPANFVPANTPYKILSGLNTSKALTVSNDKTLRISDYTGDASQKFNIYQQGNKVSLVVNSLQEGVCILKDSQENGGKASTDNGKHPSSLFELVRVPSGQWQNKAYRIRTFANHKVLDISEGNLTNGTPIIQWDEHGNYNQIWLVVPADQPVPKKEATSGSSLFGINLPNVNVPNFGNFGNLSFPKFG